MFEVTVEATFAAAHQLRNYKGKCENLHGHNYRVRVTVEGPSLNETNGLLADFGEVKGLLREVTERLDHQYLNELEPFTTINPSAENVAWFICQEIEKGMADGDASVPVRVAEVRVWETDTSVAAYRPPKA